jgi:small-conductance mechanosensitive channel
MFIYKETISVRLKERETLMSRKPPSKDEAFEALDFIVNVLKEHEKDLDKLINELGTVTEQMGDTGVLSTKVEKVEERLGTLQNEITNLISYLSASPRNVQSISSQFSQVHTQDAEKTPSQPARASNNPPVILRCKEWEDFKTLTNQAQTMSFMYKETEKTFQVDALKENQIITYSGELPKYNSVLKAWLARQLDIPEKKVLEGILAIG